MTDLHRLIYTSRNLLGGGEAEQDAAVAGILAVSKRNNARVGVTGALLFNAGTFAQVLEGPRAAVEATFERIQRDQRHGDVSVLQCEPVAARGFPNWSMAFVGRSERGRTLWGEMARRSSFDFRHMEADKLFSTLLAVVEDEEDMVPDAVLGAPRGPAPRDVAPREVDVEALRDALREQMPGLDLSAATGPRAEVEVLRGALDEERGRTTDLRRDLDEARVALAIARNEALALGRLRDIWAERARAMAAVMCREPVLPDAAAQGHDASTRPARPTLAKVAS